MDCAQIEQNRCGRVWRRFTHVTEFVEKEASIACKPLIFSKINANFHAAPFFKLNANTFIGSLLRWLKSTQQSFHKYLGGPQCVFRLDNAQHVVTCPLWRLCIRFFFQGYRMYVISYNGTLLIYIAAVRS